MTDTRRHLTLEEIGELAGVSRSTVSRVLNDHPHVRPDVRSKVAEVIRETGYLPNQAARALVSNRTGVIGLVMPTQVDDLFGDPYYSALVEGIQQGCAELGSVLSIYPVDGERDQTLVLSAVVAQGFVDGVIVTAGPRSERLINSLRGRGKRLVVVGHPADDHAVLRVDVDNRGGSETAVAHLYRLGRRRIGFVGPGADYEFGVERLQGYRDALDAAGLPLDETLVHFGEPTVDGGHRAALGALRRHPDALHVATDTMAAGVLRAADQAGMSVPADVAIVGFDGLPNAPEVAPRLSTVVQPVVDVGRAAVQLLHDDDSTPRAVVLPTTLNIQESCGSPGAAPAAT